MECFQFQMADTKSAIHISGRGATTGNKIQSVENIKIQSSMKYNREMVVVGRASVTYYMYLIRTWQKWYIHKKDQGNVESAMLCNINVCVLATTFQYLLLHRTLKTKK